MRACEDFCTKIPIGREARRPRFARNVRRREAVSVAGGLSRQSQGLAKKGTSRPLGRFARTSSKNYTAILAVSEGISLDFAAASRGALSSGVRARSVGERGASVSHCAGSGGISCESHRLLKESASAPLLTRFARNVRRGAAASVSGGISCESCGASKGGLQPAGLLFAWKRRAKARPTTMRRRRLNDGPVGASVGDAGVGRLQEWIDRILVAGRRVFARTGPRLRQASRRGIDTQHAP
jgi:hypothetical protein